MPLRSRGNLIDQRRRAAAAADIAALQHARIQARDLDNHIRRVEAAAARAFAARAAGALDLARELTQMRDEIELVESAGLRSPATVYADPSETTVADLSEPARAAVSHIIDSDMAVQPLHAHDTAEKNAVIRAVALTAHHNDDKVLAIPASPAAAEQARTRRYAHATATPGEAINNLTTGVWKPPPGSLLIVDDADHLDPDQLRRLTTHAGATNTKLLLVTNDTGTPGPSHALTTALADILPWSQHLGTAPSRPDPGTALARVANYIHGLSTIPDDDAHHEATTLLARRDTLIDVYRAIAAPLAARHTGHTTGRDLGVSL